jgi:hypothetical protein
MVPIIVALAFVVAGSAAVRSTWSPCGQSMLSQLTPIGEAARGHRYRSTAALYIAGAVVGGATLGALLAALALAVGALDLSAVQLLALAALVSLAGAAVDSGALGVAPPFFRRQVNENWLGRYRAWVYAGGFGWQIGTGVTTYVMTSAVFVTVALGALSAEPGVAFLIGLSFGALRGAAVLLTARVRNPGDLFALHRRFDALGEPVRRAVIAVQRGAAVVAVSAAVGPVLGLVVLATLAATGTAVVVARLRTSAGTTTIS